MNKPIPFALSFEGPAARFPFIVNGKPVTTVGGKPAPFCVISCREAGDMAFRPANKSREEFFRALGVLPHNVYSLFQVHSRDVFSLGGPGTASPLPPPKDFAREGDGMVSFTDGVFLAVSVADCLPVFLLDTEHGFFAALHSGWKGTGIVLRALDIMRKAGSRPEAIAAVLGPCIQGCCYKVDEARAKQFEAEFGPASPHINKADISDDVFTGDFPLGEVTRRDSAGGVYLNLQAANARLLAADGVQHIAYCTDCTFTDTRLGSYRREGADAYTRMIAMAGCL